jgi:hypothetical protein
MKSLAPILLSLLLAAGAVTAAAQETNAPSGQDFSYFNIIARKNIFDQSRTGLRSLNGRRPQPRIERITLLGINGDHGAGEAYFGGNGASDRFLKIGDHFDGFEVSRMTPDSVRLSNSNNVFVLDLVKRRSLRRVDDGPWEGSSDMSEPVTTNTNSTDEVAASATGATGAADAPRPGESAMERKLRLRREQEEK